ncbi:unnamed protein product [Lampetra planeri]
MTTLTMTTLTTTGEREREAGIVPRCASAVTAAARGVLTAAWHFGCAAGARRRKLDAAVVVVVGIMLLLRAVANDDDDAAPELASTRVVGLASVRLLEKVLEQGKNPAAE